MGGLLKTSLDLKKEPPIVTLSSTECEQGGKQPQLLLGALLP